MLDAIVEAWRLWRDYLWPRAAFERERAELLREMEAIYRELYRQGETEDRARLAEAMCQLIDARWDTTLA